MPLLNDIVFWLTIKPRIKKLQKLLPEAAIYPTGSRYVCSPPVMNTDIDFLIYNEADIDQELILAGYIKHTLQYPITEGEKFSTWRRGNENLIVTSSVKFAEGFHTATHICKTRNVRRKFHRVLAHEALRGVWVNELTSYLDMNQELFNLLASFNGPYGHALHLAYRAQHGLGRL